MRARRKNFKRISIFVVLIIMLMLFISPIYWVIITSFKQPVDILSKVTYVPWVDFKPGLHAWKYALFGYVGTQKSFLDSLIVAVGSSTISLVVGSLAGYGLSKFKYSVNTFIFGRWESKDIAFWFVSQWMMPPIVIAFSFFLMYRYLHLLDTRLGLIIAFLAFNIPFMVWVTRSYFSEIPKELEESALIDGCSRWTAFIKISVPLASSGLAAAFIFNFLFSWNEYLLGLMLSFTQIKPIPLLISGEVMEVGTRWWNMSAISLISIMPAVIMGPLLGRFFTKGIIGSLK